MYQGRESEIRRDVLSILSRLSKSNTGLDNMPDDFEPLAFFGIDSLGAVNLFLEIESNFSIKFGSEFEDMESIEKLSSLCKRIKEKIDAIS